MTIRQAAIILRMHARKHGFVVSQIRLFGTPQRFVLVAWAGMPNMIGKIVDTDIVLHVTSRTGKLEIVSTDFNY